MSVQSRIISLTATQLGLGEDEVSLDSNFMDDLGADSLDTVELIMQFEEDFDIDIPDEDAEKILSVNDALEYIQKNV